VRELVEDGDPNLLLELGRITISMFRTAAARSGGSEASALCTWRSKVSTGP
jgi:hypothetical protein